MKKMLPVVLVLVLVVVALGYWRGWYSLTKGGNVDVQVDSAKFAKDKEEFSKTVGEKAQSMKGQIARLWEHAEGFTGDEKGHAQKDLSELEEKHDRLVQQIKELDDVGPGKFQSIRQDLSKSLEDVEKKIEELTKKLEKGKEQ